MRNNTEPAPHHIDSKQELIRFLDKLWRYNSPQAWCYAIVHMTEDYTSFRHFCIDEFNGFEPLLEAVADYVERNKHNWRRWKTHVYFQVLPMTRKPQSGRGSASDVYVAKVFFADFDFKSPLEKRPEEETGCREKQDHELECIYAEGGKWYYVKRPSLSEFLKQVSEVAEPSLIVDSGGGYHIYYLLNEEISVDKFKKLQAKLVERLGADPHAKDPARILRLPGTVNPRVKRECRLIFDSGKTYSFEELKQLIEAQPGKKLTEFQSPAPTGSKDSQLRKLSNEEVKRIVELLKVAYVEGNRQSLSLYLAGWAAKSRISPVSVAQIITKLHEATDDEDPLEKRLQAVMYSYPKAGIDISQYLDDIEKETGIRPKLPDPREQVEVKGKAGVQEILERVLEDENEILTIMQELTDIFGSPSPWTGDAIFAPLDEVRKVYAVIDYSKLRMGIVKLTGTDGTKKLEFSPIIAEVAPTRIIIHKNPIDHSETFETWFEGPGLKDRDPPLVIGPAEADEIAAELERRALLQVRKETFLHAFSALLTKLLHMNRVEIKKDIPYPGIFLLDGKITISKYELKEIDREKLKTALMLLEELAGRYNRRKFATIVKWGAAAPFSFLRKQLELWNRWLFLHGNSATGKTTLGRIILYLWGLRTWVDKGSLGEKYEILASGGSTPARIAYLLSTTTFPRLVNEGEDMFFNPSVVTILKGAIDSTHARGIMDRGKYRNYLSMASLVLTSNKPFTKQLDPATAEPLSRKMIVITFSSAEKFSEEQQKDFNEKVKPRLPELREIGNCILNVALQAGVDFFKREITELQLGKELLAKCYELAGLQPPPWLDEEYHASESALEELNIVELFRNRARLEILKWYYNHYSRSPPTEDKTVLQRLERAIVEGLVRGIAFIPRGVDETVYGEVVIMREFLDQIELDIELKSLAHELGWKYDRVYIPKEAKKSSKTLEKNYGQMWAITIGLHDFTDFLTMSPLTQEDIEAEKRLAEQARQRAEQNNQPTGQSSQGAEQPSQPSTSP